MRQHYSSVSCSLKNLNCLFKMSICVITYTFLSTPVTNKINYYVIDYGAATQRMCLQRSPSDDEERCAYTMWNHRKVYMCFCNGDLCNAAHKTSNPSIVLALIFIIQQFLF